MIDAEDHNAQVLERLFDECVDEGMSYEDAEIEAYKRFGTTRGCNLIGGMLRWFCS